MHHLRYALSITQTCYKTYSLTYNLALASDTDASINFRKREKLSPRRRSALGRGTFDPTMFIQL